MPFIPYPDVPAEPGVPAVFRAEDDSSRPGQERSTLGRLVESIFGVPQWGLYRSLRRPALVFDTFLGITFKHETEVAQAKIENSKVSPFNKTEKAWEVIVTLAHSGYEASRSAMLEDLERMVRGTELYSIVTPEITYPSVTLKTYSYERGEKNGASMLVVALTLILVRELPDAKASKTQEPSGAAQQSNGQVQPTSQVARSGRPQNSTGERGRSR